jgi:hypothetical protein
MAIQVREALVELLDCCRTGLLRVAGLQSGPKPLWISELIKVSHSTNRYRASVPCAGARPTRGAWSTKY